jgi:hypothetical protein
MNEFPPGEINDKLWAHGLVTFLLSSVLTTILLLKGDRKLEFKSERPLLLSPKTLLLLLKNIEKK